MENGQHPHSMNGLSEWCGQILKKNRSHLNGIFTGITPFSLLSHRGSGLEFYIALLDVEDIEAMLWTVTIRKVTFICHQTSSGIYGLQRSIGAYPAMEMANKPNAEDIFRSFTGQNIVLIRPFFRQKFMLPFWDILHLIFVYNIKPKAHTTECPILRGELMQFVAKGYVIYLPLYVFLTLRSEAKITSFAALLYSLLLTQFLHSMGYMDSQNKESKMPISPICRPL
ncbi:hypothetical protein CJ030_MR1G010278 [Morella rubra]|uniref:Uncharacterized protein n=1 Tax=Morella rubra TaxID=262757 RepID=A0A6A1WXX4_9ROSI|nr:hypothetical protein CJ030_MR1G010278 [Morella rubra]